MNNFEGFKGYSEKEDGTIFELNPIGMFEFDPNDGQCYIDTIPNYLYIKDEHDLAMAQKFLLRIVVKDDEDEDVLITFSSRQITKPGIYVLEYNAFEDSDYSYCADIYYREISGRIDDLQKQLNSYKIAKDFICSKEEYKAIKEDN